LDNNKMIKATTDFPITSKSLCPRCFGDKEVNKEPCPKCKGKGTVIKKEENG